VLVPFKPYITKTGAGYNGADVSELYTSKGYQILGHGMIGAVSMAVADDFIVPDGEVWDVSTIRWLAYQTHPSTPGFIYDLSLNLWNTPIGGQMQGSQWRTSGGNVLSSKVWTGVYRVADVWPLEAKRPIIELTGSGTWAGTLPPGHYWISASASGPNNYPGPYAPVATKAGQVPPTGDPWNGHQSLGAQGAFQQVFDNGTASKPIHEPADFLFQVEGAAQSVSYFCTSKTSSLGCIPLLTSSSVAVSLGSAWPTTVTAGPVPGGVGLPGILLHSKVPPVAPVLTQFGFLCLGAFERAGAFPASPGGSAGACDGVYDWDLSAIASATPSVQPGDTLRIQAWYRDTGFAPPGNANFTNGVQPQLIVP